jgi:hypothetical protein
VRLELVRLLELMSQDLVVVYFSIDRQSDATIRAQEWLCSRVDSHNAQSLVNEDGVLREVVATPVRASMPNSLAQPQSSGFEFLHIGMAVVEQISICDIFGLSGCAVRWCWIGTYQWQANMPHMFPTCGLPYFLGIGAAINQVVCGGKS